MIKTISQAIDDMAVSLGANPSPHIPTVSQALENVYAALGGTRTDLDTLVVSEVIDLLTPLIHSGGGGGGGGDFSGAILTIINNDPDNEIEIAGDIAFEEGELGEGSPPCIFPEGTIPQGETQALKFGLYKGSSIINMFYSEDDEYAISGDIQHLYDYAFLLTGNATITFGVK